MTFECDGRTYDTSAMTVVTTGNPVEPVAYFTADHSEAFVMIRTNGHRPRIERVTGPERDRLAARYGSRPR